MIVKAIKEEDFINYKKPSMFIITPTCNFKCCTEAGNNICQNMSLVKQPNIEISNIDIVNRYIDNPITKSIVFGGLEPFDSFDDVLEIITILREKSEDDIVIYTGYNKEEIIDKVNLLKNFKNIIIKYGRFIPNQEKHYDEILGVELASTNQWAEKIS